MRRGAGKVNSGNVDEALSIFFPSLSHFRSLCEVRNPVIREPQLLLLYIYLQIVYCFWLHSVLPLNLLDSHVEKRCKVKRGIVTPSACIHLPSCALVHVCQPWQLCVHVSALDYMMDLLLAGHKRQRLADLLTSEAGGSFWTSDHTAGYL